MPDKNGVQDVGYSARRGLTGVVHGGREGSACGGRRKEQARMFFGAQETRAMVWIEEESAVDCSGWVLVSRRWGAVRGGMMNIVVVKEVL